MPAIYPTTIIFACRALLDDGTLLMLLPGLDVDV